MKSKLSALLIAAYLMVGCSSGGSTSGAGGGSATTTDGLLLTASLVMDVGGNTADRYQLNAMAVNRSQPERGTFTITNYRYCEPYRRIISQRNHINFLFCQF